MTTKSKHWVWAIGVPGAVVAGFTLVYGGLSAFFETHKAHADEVKVWRDEHLRVVATAETARQQTYVALKGEVTATREDISKYHQSLVETRLDVNQIVCVVVRKGKPIGPRCVLANGMVIEDPRVATP